MSKNVSNYIFYIIPRFYIVTRSLKLNSPEHSIKFVGIRHVVSMTDGKIQVHSVFVVRTVCKECMKIKHIPRQIN